MSSQNFKGTFVVELFTYILPSRRFPANDLWSITNEGHTKLINSLAHYVILCWNSRRTFKIVLKFNFKIMFHNCLYILISEILIQIKP